MNKVTLDAVKKNNKVQIYIERANNYLGTIGYTEHGTRHASLTASIAHNIISRIKHNEREAQLAGIAGYLHDIGNIMGRSFHSQSGAIIAYNILSEMEMDSLEIAKIIEAIGTHEVEESGEEPTSEIASALAIADKSDVHRSRVRNPAMTKFDIHDRVNYAAEHSFLRVNETEKTMALEITIDTKISQVMEYFEIFLTRMLACRKAARRLECEFQLIINNIKLM